MSRANGSGAFGSAMARTAIGRTTVAVASMTIVLLLGVLITPTGAQSTTSTVASTPSAAPTSSSGDSSCPSRTVRTANGGFEGPVTTTGTAAAFEMGSVRGWTTARKRLTLAASGYQDDTAATGRQFLVLSTSTSTAVHQDLPTTPSETSA